MALALFLSIVKKVDLDTKVNPIYRRVAIVIFWLYTGSWTVSSANLKAFVPSGTICNPSGSQPGFNYALFVQMGVIFIIVIPLMAISARYMAVVFRAVKSETVSQREKAILLLMIRFISMAFLQSVPALLANVSYLETNITGSTNPTLSQGVLATRFVCHVSDALILMVMNRSLRRFVKKAYCKVFNQTYLDKSTSGSSSNSAKLTPTKNRIFRSTSNDNSSGDFTSNRSAV